MIKVWKSGLIGEKYNVGGECEITNIDLVKKILYIMNKPETMIEHVNDRPGHDRRYSTSISKIRNTLFWTPTYSLDYGLKKTIDWYMHDCNFIKNKL